MGGKTPVGAGSCHTVRCRPSLGKSRWVYLPRSYPSCAAWGGVGALSSCLLVLDVALGYCSPGRVVGERPLLGHYEGETRLPSRGLVLRRWNGFAGVKSRNPGISRDLRRRANTTPPPRNLPLHSRASRVDRGAGEPRAILNH